MGQPIRAARVLTSTGWVDHVCVTVVDGLITAIEPAAPASCTVDLLVPGFIDLQVNGIDDVDVSSARGDDWGRLDELLLAQGVTSWCPTVVSMPLGAYAAVLERIDGAMQRPATGAARPSIVGAHLEGPFLGRAHGAHRPDMVVEIDLDWLRSLPGHVAMMTLGAEQPRAVEAIEALVARQVLVSIGHSNADDAALDAAVAAGAAMVTHLFNAMSGLHHRTPGVAAWALTHPTLRASLIADLVHVHPRMIDLAFRLLGPHRAVLVTDAVGWRSGRAGPVGLSVHDGAPRLADGTLAGSALTMDAAVRNCVDAGVAPEHAVRAASTVPARLLGLSDRGSIEVGARGDLVALDSDLSVRRVWTGGVPFDPS